MPPKIETGLIEIYDILSRLGVRGNYTGFYHTSYAIYLVVQQPERLLLVTKWLYPEVAKHYGINWSRVERNIRTVVRVAWGNNRPLLEELAHHPLPSRPTASQFIAIIASCLSFDAA